MIIFHLAAREDKEDTQLLVDMWQMLFGEGIAQHKTH
jgi:hypothetical protein